MCREQLIPINLIFFFLNNNHITLYFIMKRYINIILIIENKFYDDNLKKKIRIV